MRTLLLISLLAAPLLAQAKHAEQWYTDQWCKAHGGDTSVVLSDHTRPDCVTDTHAVEVDFGPKWAEAIGQSLHYGFKTNLKPGVLLIVDPSDHLRYFYRLNSVVMHYSEDPEQPVIDVWTVDK